MTSLHELRKIQTALQLILGQSKPTHFISDFNHPTKCNGNDVCNCTIQRAAWHSQQPGLVIKNMLNEVNHSDRINPNLVAKVQLVRKTWSCIYRTTFSIWLKVHQFTIHRNHRKKVCNWHIWTVPLCPAQGTHKNRRELEDESRKRQLSRQCLF